MLLSNSEKFLYSSASLHNLNNKHMRGWGDDTRGKELHVCRKAVFRAESPIQKKKKKSPSVDLCTCHLSWKVGAMGIPGALQEVSLTESLKFSDRPCL